MFQHQYFDAKDHFFGIFIDDILRFIIPAFEINGNLEATPKLYTEIIRFGDHDLVFPQSGFLEYIKKNKTFGSIKFNLCYISEKIAKDFSKLGKSATVSHILKLKSINEDRILAEIISHKTRNQIKTAHKRGNFHVKFENNIDIFFRLYLKSMKRLKSIPKEQIFFTNLWSSFGDNLKIVAVYQSNDLAAANLVMVKNKYLHVAFSVSSSHYFKDYVNDLLYWETIKFGLKNGIECFDFGPSSLKDKSHQHFKEGFGAKAIPIYKIVSYNSVGQRIGDFLSHKSRNLKLRIKRWS